MDGSFERALEDCTDEPARTLVEIVEAIEAGVPLTPVEVALVNRLAAQIPPRPSKQFLEDWHPIGFVSWLPSPDPPLLK